MQAVPALTVETGLQAPFALVFLGLLAARGDTFDGRFDSTTTFWEALTRIAYAGRCKPYMQGGIVYFRRDQAVSLPVALYSMRNIVRGSFSMQFLTPSDDTADAVEVSYFDKDTWKPRRLVCKLPDSTAAKPAKIELFGVTNREQAYREGVYLAAANRYRRTIIKFTTEMEGFIPSYGDLIAVNHDLPQWGQFAEVVAGDAVKLGRNIVLELGSRDAVGKLELDAVDRFGHVGQRAGDFLHGFSSMKNRGPKPPVCCND